MRRADTARRGAPLVMLLTAFAVWSVYRAVAWEDPFFSPQVIAGGKTGVSPQANRPASIASSIDGDIIPTLKRSESTSGSAGVLARSAFPALLALSPSERGGAAATRAAKVPAVFEASSHPSLSAFVAMPPPEQTSIFEQVSPRTPANANRPAVPLSVAQVRTDTDRSRWSGDAWVFLREGSSSALISPEPRYGRSQIGGVLRYDIASQSGARPQIYLRSSTAVEVPRQGEIAAGVSVRLMPVIPLRFHGEARVFQSGSSIETRGAAFVVTELPTQRLPANLRAESYVQAGYVTGRFATAFVDGQARVTRSVVEENHRTVDIGAGAWGGAQEGASRFDVGPTASLSARLGAVNARISADYRFRVAGDAEPESGPAITISAGF